MADDKTKKASDILDTILPAALAEADSPELKAEIQKKFTDMKSVVAGSDAQFNAYIDAVKKDKANKAELVKDQPAGVKAIVLLRESEPSFETEKAWHELLDSMLKAQGKGKLSDVPEDKGIAMFSTRAMADQYVEMESAGKQTDKDKTLAKDAEEAGKRLKREVDGVIDANMKIEEEKARHEEAIQALEKEQHRAVFQLEKKLDETYKNVPPADRENILLKLIDKIKNLNFDVEPDKEIKKPRSADNTPQQDAFESFRQSILAAADAPGTSLPFIPAGKDSTRGSGKA